MRRALHVTDLLDDIVPVESAQVDLDAVVRIIERLEADRFAREPLLAVVAELRTYRSEHARPSPNGRAHGAFTLVCASCGREFTSNRRAVPGKKSWCGRPECRKVAAAERAREYRDRKTKEEKP